MRRPTPKALLVTFKPGAACRRLYSFKSIRRTTRLTVASSKPRRRFPPRIFPSPRRLRESRRARRRAAANPGRSGSGAARPTAALVMDGAGMISRSRINPVGQPVDHRLGHVADHGQTAAHVAVERAIARRPVRSCCRWSAAASRTCSTAPSASRRAGGPGCFPRSCPRRGRRRPASTAAFTASKAAGSE